MRAPPLKADIRAPGAKLDLDAMHGFASSEVTVVSARIVPAGTRSALPRLVGLVAAQAFRAVVAVVCALGAGVASFTNSPGASC